MTDRQKRSLAAVLMIGAAIILLVIDFLVGGGGVTDKLMNAALIVGLIAGLLYIRAGYRKFAAIYYKTFFILYAVQSVYNVAVRIVATVETQTEAAAGTTVFGIVGVVVFFLSALGIILLAAGQNLHKKPSLLIAGINMALVFVFTLVEIIVCEDFPDNYAVYIGSVILAIVAYLFVTDKYVDKDARGAK